MSKAEEHEEKEQPEATKVQNFIPAFIEAIRSNSTGKILEIGYLLQSQNIDIRFLSFKEKISEDSEEMIEKPIDTILDNVEFNVDTYIALRELKIFIDLSNSFKQHSAIYRCVKLDSLGALKKLVEHQGKKCLNYTNSDNLEPIFFAKSSQVLEYLIENTEDLDGAIRSKSFSTLSINNVNAEIILDSLRKDNLIKKEEEVVKKALTDDWSSTGLKLHLLNYTHLIDQNLLNEVLFNLCSTYCNENAAKPRLKLLKKLVEMEANIKITSKDGCSLSDDGSSLAEFALTNGNEALFRDLIKYGSEFSLENCYTYFAHRNIVQNLIYSGFSLKKIFVDLGRLSVKVIEGISKDLKELQDNKDWFIEKSLEHIEKLFEVNYRHPLERKGLEIKGKNLSLPPEITDYIIEFIPRDQKVQVQEFLAHKMVALQEILLEIPELAENMDGVYEITGQVLNDLLPI